MLSLKPTIGVGSGRPLLSSLSNLSHILLSVAADKGFLFCYTRCSGLCAGFLNNR